VPLTAAIAADGSPETMFLPYGNMYFSSYTIGLLLFTAPAVLLGLVAQLWIRSTYAAAGNIPAGMSGAQAAAEILRSSGLHQVAIEQVPGHLSDHYDPARKVLRLSEEVYHGRSLAALGIAAHEAGHALQDAQRYAPLVVRNLAVSVAGIGGNLSLALMALGVAFSPRLLLPIGMALFCSVVFFQLVNLPVEYNASSRAKAQLAALNMVDQREMFHVSRVLHAAALTYVAATLQAMLTLLFYLLHFFSQRRHSREGENDQELPQ
jgi:Zn-dependent membrane protease YugP